MTTPSEPVKLDDLIAFLRGEGPLEGRWFGEPDEKGHAFWWRKHLHVFRRPAPSEDAVRDVTTAILMHLNRSGHRADTLECLTQGDGRGTVPPRTLEKAVAAALASLPQPEALVIAREALPDYGEWLPKVWDAYLTELVGWEDKDRWARLPETFRWHEFHERLSAAIKDQTP